MSKISQAQQLNVPNNPAVLPLQDMENREKEQKEMYKKELDFTMKQINVLQTKVQDLQKLVAQTIDQPDGEQFEQLDRLENEEQKDLDVQQDVNLSEQEMQQERLLQEQQLQQERQMQMQQQMVQPMIQPMFQIGKKATWVKSEKANIKIAIKNTELYCDVAATPRQQASGLQAYDNLQENRGLWFPFNTRKSATFHMGEVKFPIDIIFIDNNKIAKIVANINPRQPGSWSNICTDVVEVNGGWCLKNKIGVGDNIVLPTNEKIAAANSYDTLRTITTAEDNEEYTPEELEIIRVFPHLKNAQIYPGTMVPAGWKNFKSIPESDYEEYIKGVDMSDIDNATLKEMLGTHYEDYNSNEDHYKVEVYVERQGQGIDIWCNIVYKNESIDHHHLANDYIQIKNIKDVPAEMQKAFKIADDYINKLTIKPGSKFKCPTCGRDADYGQPCWWCGNKVAKIAQEHRQPDTTDNRYDEHDRRNPETRYKHNTTPDVESPQGDGDPSHVDPLSSELSIGNYSKHFEIQNGYDPVTFREEDSPVAIRPTAQLVTVQSPSSDTELAGLDMNKLASGSLSLYDTHSPEWHDYDHNEKYDGDPGYNKIAIINDQLISNWIDSLGFDSKDEAMLRKSMFTDEYKRLLGETLVTSGQATNFELFDSDLLLYK